MLARGKKVAKAEGFSAPGPAQPPDWHADSQNPHPFLNCRKGGLQSCCRCHSERSVPMFSFSGNRAFRFPVGTRSRRISPKLLLLRVPHPACPEPAKGVSKGGFSDVVILSEASRCFLSPKIVPSDFRSGRAVEESLRSFP